MSEEAIWIRLSEIAQKLAEHEHHLQNLQEAVNYLLEEVEKTKCKNSGSG